MKLIDALATTEPLAALFEDESVLAALLSFEVALARAEAGAGIIGPEVADAIERAADPSHLDVSALARDAHRAGTLAIPLVKALTARVRAEDPAAAGFVHWGATSQDVVDTALVLLLQRARPLLEGDHVRLTIGLERIAREHADTVMLGRTLLQAAPPVTLGLKAAGWLGAARRGWVRLSDALEDARVLQLGGATGTLAALGEKGIEVSESMASRLGLDCPDASWHGHRDRLAAVVTACGIYTASLGKMARDLALLMQGEVGEVAEQGEEGRGGSSTMPHKRNPTGCALAISAAERVPGLVASFLGAMVQEHERGVGGWQAEWPIVIPVIQATGLAVASMAEVVEGLAVYPERMRANLRATRGTIFAERAMIMLGASLGRDVAHALLERATRVCLEEKRGLAEVLAGMPELAGVISPAELSALDEADRYLGSADAFRLRLLSSDPG